MQRLSKFGVLGTLLAVAGLLLVPYMFLPTDQRLISRVLIMGLFALSLNLLVGNAGVMSFGHGLFYGVGAYAVSVMWLHWSLSPLWSLLLAPLFGAAAAILTGLIAFRAKRLYFALLTLGLSQVAYVVVVQWYSLTQGENGIYGVTLPDWLTATSAKYWFILCVVSIGTALLFVIVASPFGSMLRAIRDNRERVTMLGINPLAYEFTAYVIAGSYAALAGACLAILDQSSFPGIFSWTTGALPLIMIVLGGSAYFFGPFLGSMIVVAVQYILQDHTSHINLFFGAMVIVMTILAPSGITGGLDSIRRAIVALFSSSRRVDAPAQTATVLGDRP